MKLLRSAVVLAAAAVVLVPSAAQADADSHRDAVGDVRSVAYDPGTGKVVESPSTAEPAARLGDMTKIKVSHTSSSLTFVLRYRDLAKAGFRHVHEVVIVTPKFARYVDVVAGPGNWKGKAQMSKPNRKKVACSIGRRIDYGDNVVTIKVPRSCVGSPKVVKVGAVGLIGYGSKIFYDEAYSAGGEFTDPFTLSPKIRR